MRRLHKLTLMALLFGASGIALANEPKLLAQEPSWTGAVIKRGQDRVQSNATDILDRPYRPLHFYGNTIRRSYYRGVARPTLNDVRTTITQLMRRS
ncbi:MAG: hypothetical protein KDB22_10540 [Planctomycetales bacterium]|nr:hypothetical protein [Planctomycetales bacterium]